MLGLGLGVPQMVLRARARDPLRALIAQLYGNGEQGAMYIPKPVVLGQQVLFQDAAGTVPVVDDGDPVGLMLDLSGNDAPVFQETATRKPVINKTSASLIYDGVDDFLDSDIVVDGNKFGNGFVWSFWGRWDVIANLTGSNGGVPNEPRMYTQIVGANRRLRHAIGSAFSDDANAFVSQGVWHHVAFLFSGSESKMFFDNALAHTMSCTFSGDSGATFALGVGFERARFMNGAIAENILSAGQFDESVIDTLYQYGKWRKSL